MKEDSIESIFKSTFYKFKISKLLEIRNKGKTRCDIFTIKKFSRIFVTVKKKKINGALRSKKNFEFFELVTFFDF